MSDPIFDAMLEAQDRNVALTGILSSVCIWAEFLSNCVESEKTFDWELGKLMDAVKEARKVMERREA